MPNTSNLKPWQPGQSGNPNGYSRSRRITDRLIELIAEKGAECTLADVWLKAALEGDIHFFRLLLDRVEGLVVPEQPDALEAEVRIVDLVAEAEKRALERIQQRALNPPSG